MEATREERHVTSTVSGYLHLSHGRPVCGPTPVGLESPRRTDRIDRVAENGVERYGEAASIVVTGEHGTDDPSDVVSPRATAFRTRFLP
jgi:hypothetical protein